MFGVLSVKRVFFFSVASMLALGAPLIIFLRFELKSNSSGTPKSSIEFESF